MLLTLIKMFHKIFANKIAVIHKNKVASNTVFFKK